MIPIVIIPPVLKSIPKSTLGSLGALFLPAYDIVDDHEGGYVNDPDDLGGETYRGIARAFHPYWEGWSIIDFIKSRFGPIETNTFIYQKYPTYRVIDDYMVPSFYEGVWFLSGADKIASQQVANIYFDFFILASSAVATMQEALVNLGFNVTIDNAIGPQTLGAINQADPAKLHDEFRRLRFVYHDVRINRGSVSEKYRRNWETRTANFPILTNGGGKVLDNVWVKTALFTGAIALILNAGHLNNRLKLGDYTTSKTDKS